MARSIRWFVLIMVFLALIFFMTDFTFADSTDPDQTDLTFADSVDPDQTDISDYDPETLDLEEGDAGSGMTSDSDLADSDGSGSEDLSSDSDVSGESDDIGNQERQCLPEIPFLGHMEPFPEKCKIQKFKQRINQVGDNDADHKRR